MSPQADGLGGHLQEECALADSEYERFSNCATWETVSVMSLPLDDDDACFRKEQFSAGLKSITEAVRTNFPGFLKPEEKEADPDFVELVTETTSVCAKHEDDATTTELIIPSDDSVGCVPPPVCELQSELYELMQ